jgi:hypothetical protein
MTEIQAHEFLSKWSRRWLGRKPMSENEAIRKMKANCLILIFQAILPISVGLPKVVYNSEKNCWFYILIFIVTFSVLTSIFSTWLLARIYQSCKTLNKKF